MGEWKRVEFVKWLGELARKKADGIGGGILNTMLTKVQMTMPELNQVEETLIDSSDG